MGSVLLFVDPQSPYGYLAHARAEAVLGVAPEIRPILLGPIFLRRGWGSWARSSERERQDGMRDVEQRAAAYGLPPVVWPAGWPSDSLAPARAATWADAQGRGSEFLGALFHRMFVHAEDPTDIDILRCVAGQAGLDPAALEPGITASSTKLELREATERAWEVGVRGVPTTQVGDELFFGDDRLEAAATAASRPESRRSPGAR